MLIPKPKIIVIVGPTASGKSDMAVKLARAFKGEVISADSRQVYKGLDIGSGKITPKEMKGVLHHLLDVESPKKVFTVAQYQKLGQEKIKEIISRRKVPIICGGSGFYIQALVDSVVFPEVLPNKKLRAVLEKKTTLELGRMLKKLDPRRYSEIDKDNPVRLVRAIEIATALGKVPKIQKKISLYNPLFIGLAVDSDELKYEIKKRLLARMKKDMVTEVRNLHKNGLSWKRLESFGLEYRAIALFLQQKISREEMMRDLETQIWHFAKRQMTWFRRDKGVQWFKPTEWRKIRAKTHEFLRGN